MLSASNCAILSRNLDTSFCVICSRSSAFDFAAFASIALAVITLAGIIFMPLIVRLIAPGFFQDPSKFGLTVELSRIMFCYIFFISLVALASGVLNSMGHFAAPAAAPAVRVAAAKAILDAGLKFVELHDLAERLAALEAIVKRKDEK